MLYVRVAYCVVGLCNMWFSGVMCGRAVYCVLGRYTVC